MNDADPTVLDAVAGLVPPLFGTLDTLNAVARAMHPPQLLALVDSIGDHDERLAAAMRPFQAAEWPVGLLPVHDRLAESADLALEGCAGLRAAAAAGQPMDAFRALGRHTRAIEALYPLANNLPTIGRWFLHDAHRDDTALLERLRENRPGTGVTNVCNDRDSRGGFSMYIPEYLDPTTPAPLVVTLHGGSGHGRQSLWTWIREARSSGLILIAPTSIGRTWSLNDPDVDIANLDVIVERIRADWSIDPTRMLLTGISDGGTFTFVDGLLETSQFTHLAPIAAAFHPMLVAMSEPERTAGLPIYLIHGVLDWMFPVTLARTANVILTEAGARVTYREIRDLSHTHPSEENARIVEWLLAR